MANPVAQTSAGYIWAMRAGYIALSLALIFTHLLPLETAPRRWIGPDLILVVSFVWIARRPDIIPLWLVAPMFFLGDLLLQRPPGLWSTCAVLATEALRMRAEDLRDMVFVLEWSVAAVILIAFYIVYFTLWSLLVPFDISGSLLTLQLVLTLLCYPVVAGLSWLVSGLGKTAPGQVDAKGRVL